MSATDIDIPRIIISTGEPAGIGPNIIIQIIQENIAADIVAIGDPDLLKNRALQLNVPLKLVEFDESTTKQKHIAGTLKIIPLKTKKTAIPGKLDPSNVQYVLTQLKMACIGCLDKKFDAMVTAPVQKSIINTAGYTFTGHTEFIADICDIKTPVMMLMNNLLKIILVTTHLPLNKVSAAITKEHLSKILQITSSDLEKKFSIPTPRILVCGLNPHAGENGYLGQEERNTIIPVINELKKNQGLNLKGPQSADTAFTPKMIQQHDAIVTMYHDQGLPVLKALGFGETVNITLGLPIIRTSVDHGTALDIAHKSAHASSSSLTQAIRYAIEMTRKNLSNSHIKHLPM